MNYLLVHTDHRLSVSGMNSGAEMATLSLARFLVKRGHRVLVAGRLDGSIESSERLSFVDLGVDYDCERALSEIRRLGEYHLITAGKALPLFFAKDDPYCLSRILISHDRASNDSGIGVETLCSVVDKIVCVSDAQREVFLEAGADESKLTVIHNGVDLDLFIAGDPARRDYQKLVFSGALVPDKGLDLLLASYAELKCEFPELSLDIYGSADLWGRQEIYDTAQLERDLPGISFHGKVPQEILVQAFTAAGVCVVPSRCFDPFPLRSSIEAQVCGCPVVTFDIGGLKEGVRNGETGVVISEISQEQLSETLRALIAEPQQLEYMSRKAIELQRKYFDWSRVAAAIESLSEESSKKRKPIALSNRLGLVTTWNQQCGLAAHARYLVEQFDTTNLSIFGEETQELLQPDEDFVVRCWSRTSTDWSRLVEKVLERDIEVLHINLHTPEQVDARSFGNALKTLATEGIRIVLHLHCIFSTEATSAEYLSYVDRVVVHFDELRHELVAAGVERNKIEVIPLGVVESPRLSDKERLEIRSDLHLPQHSRIVSAVGFIQRHKGMEAVIECVSRLRGEGLDILGVIAGSCNRSDDLSAAYLEELREYAEKLHVADFVEFRIGFLAEQEILKLFQASDLVVMNYRSEHFEASGSCAQAVGVNAFVATSLAPPFSQFKDAVWPITKGFPIHRIAKTVFEDPGTRESLYRGMKRFQQKNSWRVVASKFQRLYQKVTTDLSMQTKEQSVEKHQRNEPGLLRRRLRVLIQNRPNLYTHPGGDTVLVEQTKSALEQLGVEVSIDTSLTADVTEYDLVHAVNFALPQMLQKIVENAKSKGVPCVVTTLCEDISLFHNRSIAYADALISYVNGGQQSEQWELVQQSLQQVPSCQPFENGWVAKNADALIVNGKREADIIQRLYRQSASCSIVPVGYQLKTEQASSDLFRSRYGVSDFVLCVGRLESRKNQLMLLKALEESELDIVLIGGGVNYQPEYTEAVRQFHRRGKTLVLERVSDEELASAYACAKVHVLPSWFELPGLVSLEAASFGCNVVVTSNGTAPDYFERDAFYCDPSNEDSIRNAVIAAYYAPVKPGLKERVIEFTWQRAAQKTLEVYRSLVPSETQRSQPQLSSQRIEGAPFSFDHDEFTRLVDQGQQAAQQKEFEQAQELLAKAESMNPKSVRVLRNRAAVFMACSELEKAQEYFERAYALDSSDTKTLSGLGMCSLMRQQPQEALPLFVASLEREPYEMVTILQLLDCSYRLGSFEELEKALRRYLEARPDDLEMVYCFAGCRYRQGDLEQAEEYCQKVLSKQPLHRGASELVEKLAEARATKSAPSATQLNVAVERFVQQRESLASKVVNESVESFASVPQPFDSIDSRILELEDAKHKKEYPLVRSGCTELMERSDLEVSQRKRLELLEAEVMAMTNQRAEAEAIFQRHLKEDSQCARSLCGIAAIQASEGKWQEAEQMFERARASVPTHDVSYAGLALCAHHRGDLERAWELNLAALKRNPENTTALLGVLQLAYQLGRLTILEQHLAEYLEMHPADLQFVYAYAGCLYAQERLEEARSEVEKILLFQPEHTHARELQDMIAERAQRGSALAS